MQGDGGEGTRGIERVKPLPFCTFGIAFDREDAGPAGRVRDNKQQVSGVAVPVSPSWPGGVIINTASVAAYDGTIGQAAYAAANGRHRLHDASACPRPGPGRDPGGDHRPWHVAGRAADEAPTRVCAPVASSCDAYGPGKGS